MVAHNQQRHTGTFSPVQQGTQKRTLTVALAGQPNVGKSTIFNMLTGLNQHVGNWPGKTVERKSGTYFHHNTEMLLVDLPGTYSLTANSEEERIAREYIIRETPDVVIAVVDAAIPERSLYLLSELILLPAPVVLVMNMMDVAEQEGVQIEPKVLQAALGIPVVPMIATKNQGLTAMLDAVLQVANDEFEYKPHRPTILAAHQEVLADVITAIAGYVPEPYPVDWVALKLLEGDDEVVAKIKLALPEDVWDYIHSLLYTHEDAILDIAGARYAWISRMIRAAVARPKVGMVGLTAKLDSVLTHPVWGTLGLLAVLGGVFWLTYAIGTPMQEWLGGLLSQFGAWVGSLITMWPAWLSDLLVDGIIGGAGMVVTFLPILVFFFATLGLLEDTGYMARAAYITDRYMHLMGLHGKSFMPLLLGFGCNVPSVLGARIIESKRARLLTIILSPLVPCTARMAVIAVLGGALFGERAGMIGWVLIAVNLLVLAVLGVVMNRTIFKSEQAAFIMELPLYHMPNLRTIGLYVWQNLVAFLQKAGTVILVASAVVWALSYFPSQGDVMTSYMARMGQALSPIGDLMGFPWPVMVSLLTSFVAKENTIAVLHILYGDLNAVLPTILSTPAAVALMVVQMLFIPCVATLAAIKQETNLRWTLFATGLMLTISFGAGIAVYQIGMLLGG